MHCAMPIATFATLPAPVPVVGQRMCVMHAGPSLLFDLTCGNTTVV